MRHFSGFDRPVTTCVCLFLGSIDQNVNGLFHALQPGMRLDALPINAFDVLLFVVLMFGLSRGRKHGMSEELMQLVQWTCVVVGCAFLYKPLGELLEGTSPLSLLSAYVIVYVTLMLLILAVFALLKRSIGGKLIGSDAFGKSEYYLGMISGACRFACIAIAMLALLNARSFTHTEVRAMQKYQDDLYGSNFFPGLHSVQSTVFEQSLCGPWIRSNLGLLLIEPTAPSGKALHQREYMLPE